MGQQMVTALDAVARIESAVDDSSLAGIVSQAMTRYGYEHCVFAAAPRASDHSLVRQSMLAVWPDEWLKNYEHERFWRDDRIAQACRRSARPFRWSDVAIDSPRAKRVMAVARDDYDLRDGFCVPFFAIDGYQGAVSFAGHAPSVEGNLALEMISLYAFNRLNESRNYVPSAEPRLTARQREVLAWVAGGKTTWDASVILGISVDTVNKTITSAMRRLNVHTRAQAVAEAVRLKEISV